MEFQKILLVWLEDEILVNLFLITTYNLHFHEPHNNNASQRKSIPQNNCNFWQLPDLETVVVIVFSVRDFSFVEKVLIFVRCFLSSFTLSLIIAIIYFLMSKIIYFHVAKKISVVVINTYCNNISRIPAQLYLTCLVSLNIRGFPNNIRTENMKMNWVPRKHEKELSSQKS